MVAGKSLMSTASARHSPADRWRLRFISQIIADTNNKMTRFFCAKKKWIATGGYMMANATKVSPHSGNSDTISHRERAKKAAFAASQSLDAAAGCKNASGCVNNTKLGGSVAR